MDNHSAGERPAQGPAGRPPKPADIGAPIGPPARERGQSRQRDHGTAGRGDTPGPEQARARHDSKAALPALRAMAAPGPATRRPRPGAEHSPGEGPEA